MVAVMVAEVEGKGRGMVAAQNIAAGQVVVCESPLLLYLEATSESSPSFCQHCSRSLALSASPFQCPSCSQAAFCSQTCAFTPSHPPHACQALQKLQSFAVDLDLQTHLRFLIAAYSLALSAPASFQQLLQMEGSPVVDSRAILIHSLMEDLIKGWPLENRSVELTAALLQKDNKNAFAIMAPGAEPGQRRARGYAFYAQASSFNHNCLPNVCRFDYVDDPDNPNPNIFIRALHDIPAGTEVCLSYFPINWSLAERRDRLLQEYGFECKCERCIVEEKWDNESEDGCDPNSDNEGTKPGSSMLENEEEMDDPLESVANDFPHAMFFVKYLCPGEYCGGTMAPIPPEQVMDEPTSTGTMECNVCGYLRTNEEFLQDLENQKEMEL